MFSLGFHQNEIQIGLELKPSPFHFGYDGRSFNYGISSSGSNTKNAHKYNLISPLGGGIETDDENFLSDIEISINHIWGLYYHFHGYWESTCDAVKNIYKAGSEEYLTNYAKHYPIAEWDHCIKMIDEKIFYNIFSDLPVSKANSIRQSFIRNIITTNTLVKGRYERYFNNADILNIAYEFNDKCQHLESEPYINCVNNFINLNQEKLLQHTLLWDAILNNLNKAYANIIEFNIFFGGSEKDVYKYISLSSKNFKKLHEQTYSCDVNWFTVLLFSSIKNIAYTHNSDEFIDLLASRVNHLYKLTECENINFKGINLLDIFSDKDNTQHVKNIFSFIDKSNGSDISLSEFTAELTVLSNPIRHHLQIKSGMDSHLLTRVLNNDLNCKRVIFEKWLGISFYNSSILEELSCGMYYAFFNDAYSSNVTNSFKSAPDAEEDDLPNAEDGDLPDAEEDDLLEIIYMKLVMFSKDNFYDSIVYHILNQPLSWDGDGDGHIIEDSDAYMNGSLDRLLPLTSVISQKHEYESMKHSLDFLTKKYPDAKSHPSVLHYYFVYYLATNNLNEANRYAEMILKNFPNSNTNYYLYAKEILSDDKYIKQCKLDKSYVLNTLKYYSLFGSTYYLGNKNSKENDISKDVFTKSSTYSPRVQYFKDRKSFIDSLNSFIKIAYSDKIEEKDLLSMGSYVKSVKLCGELQI